ncbi:uncharacterized protein hemgn isoform 2-T2 [Aulostomus maculatus]
MEDNLQQEVQETECKSPNEDRGGIHRRLRDRELLRKRRAEAEEKETYQEESQRKRPRSEKKSSSRRRGRPRKMDSTPSSIQEIAALAQEAPAVVVVPEPAEVIPGQTSAALTSASNESQSVPPAPGPLPVFTPMQIPVLPATLTAPASPDPTPVLDSPSLVTPPSPIVQDDAPVVVQDSDPAPDNALVSGPSQVTGPAVATAPVIAPPQVETLSTETQSRDPPDVVLIEDLGPDEKEDISPNLANKADKDLNETPSNNIPEQKLFSVSSLSSLPPQEYLSGNQY